MMDNYEFWKQRVEMHGHTGWADTSIYAFDQDIRLNVVFRLVDKNINNGGCALDFGCGTGDFTKSLLPKFDKIVMYDPVKESLDAELLKCKKIDGVSDIGRLERIGLQYDVILSITVLQHIMDDEELTDTLMFLRDSMKDNGIFLIMESFDPSITSEYERAWDVHSFRNIMRETGFELIEAYDFYDVYQDAGFQKYCRRFDVRLLKFMNRLFGLNVYSHLRKIAGRYRMPINDYMKPCTDNTGSKFMVYRKAKKLNA